MRKREKLQKIFQHTKNFIKKNKPLCYGGLFICVTGASGILPYKDILVWCAEGNLVNLTAKIYTRDKFFKLLHDLQNLADISDISNIGSLVDGVEFPDKVRNIEVYIGCIENISNKDLKDSLIISLVTSICSLYFSKSTDLNSFILGLLNALRKGKLSQRLFDIIIQMLRNRNVPVEIILEALEAVK